MKKLTFLFISLLFVFASCSTKTTIKQIQPQNQPQAAVLGFTPGSATSQQSNSNVAMGPGPVQTTLSNFFYAGNMQILNGQPLLNLCEIGITLPIATDKGIYSEFIDQYKKLNSNMAGVAFRGYLLDNKNPQIEVYPYKIAVTHVINMVSQSICDGVVPVTGTYKATNVSGMTQSAVLTLNPDFSFLLDINNNIKLKGNYNLKDANELIFFYTVPTSNMGYNGSFNPEKGTIMIPTNSGTIIYAKQ